MAKFEITSPSGKVLEIEGDTPPSEAELDEIFKSVDSGASQPQAKKGIDLTPSGLYKQALSYPMAGIRSLATGEDFNTTRQNALQAVENFKPAGGAGDFIADVAVYSQLPMLRGSSMAGKAGAFAGNALLQGGLPAGLEALKTGQNPLQSGLAGTGFAVGIQSLPIIGKLLAKPLSAVGSKAVQSITHLEPETISRAIQPDSIALDLTKPDAERLAQDTTERLREAYKNFVEKRGREVNRVADNLTNLDQRVLTQDLQNDITQIFDKYNGEKINPARNMTGELENDLQQLVASSSGDVAPKTFTQQGNIWTNGEGANYVQLNNDAESAKFFADKLHQGKISQGDVGAQVYEYPVDDYKNMKMFLSPDGKSGFALKPDGDIVSVFSHIDNPKGTGHNLIELAKSVGGKKLDAFDTFLPKFYGGHGFKTYKKDLWNEQYKPEGWNKETFAQYNNGEPAVNYMALDEITTSPTDLNKIKQQVGHMVNWSDETAKNYKNPILEQLYGKFRDRLSNLSPELAQANKAFAEAKAFGSGSSRLKSILSPKSSLENATSKLKNYKSTNDNIYQLENELVNEGNAPFLRNIDDANAAIDLLTTPETGINWLGATSLAKNFLTRPAMQAIRGYNRVAPKLEGVSDKVKQLLTIGGAMSTPTLYGGVSNLDDYNY